MNSAVEQFIMNNSDKGGGTAGQLQVEYRGRMNHDSCPERGELMNDCENATIPQSKRLVDANPSVQEPREGSSSDKEEHCVISAVPTTPSARLLEPKSSGVKDMEAAADFVISMEEGRAKELAQVTTRYTMSSNLDVREEGIGVHDEEVDSCLEQRFTRTAPIPIQEEVQPGAFHNDGRNARDVSIGDDEITIVSEPKVSATVVNTEEENRQFEQRVKEEVEAQVERRMAEQENNAEVAEIVTGFLTCWCSSKVKIVVALVVFVVTLAIILGTTLSRATEPSTVQTPTSASTLQGLTELLSSVALDGGVALQTPLSPQNSALHWLAGNANLLFYSTEKKIQRYVLATLYYSTNGIQWTNKTGWLSDADECSWYHRAGDVFCVEAAVVELDLYDSAIHKGNNLDGTIPAEIALLSNSLVELNLSGNSLMGSIPSELGLLANLKRLRLLGNDLTGTIPPELALLSSMDDLLLQNNSLTGAIPSEIGSFVALRQLKLSHNALTGSVPSDLGHLARLARMYLYGNSLTGTIPSEIGLISGLRILSLQSNDLAGTIPLEIGALAELEDLRLYENDFSGEFTCPAFIEFCFISCNDEEDVSCRSL